MGKNIVICCDGTRNHMRGSECDWTNVAKLYKSLRADDYKNAKYISGIGTHGFRERYLGLGPLSGYGIEKNIKDAYKHICKLYKPYEDHIYLFGFSRGAYTARSLAGFVRRVGLLLKDQDDELIDRAYAHYRLGHRVRSDDPLKQLLHHITRRSEPNEGERVLVYFIGVWDSVAALGPPVVPERIKQLSNYHSVELPDHVTHAYQALALHELRDCYIPVFWSSKAKAKNLEQVWFAGAHADVGGGYDDDTTLPDIALQWMQNKASKASATSQPLMIEVGANTGFEINGTSHIPYQPHNTIDGWFNGFIPTHRNLFRNECKDLWPVWDTIKLHESVQSHWQNNHARNYQYSIPAVNEQLHEIDDRSLQFYCEQRSEYDIGFASD